MQGSGLIKWLVAGLVALLLVLMVCKPHVDNDFNTAYLDNIADMQALSGQLLRDHLMVRQGLVRHYDFLEADLEMMERTAQLAAHIPRYVGKDYRVRAALLLEHYVEAVVALREQVENSKRGTGLLRNAKAAFRHSLAELNTQVARHSDPRVVAVLNELNHALVYRELDRPWLEKLDQLQAQIPEFDGLVRQSSLHGRMIDLQQRQLAESSARLYTELEQLQQPVFLKELFVEQFVATTVLTAALLWGSYAIVAVLLVLCGVLLISSRKAQEQAQRSTQHAREAQAASERRVQETQVAVARCNDVLSRIAKGDFAHRLQGPFDEELELLRTGINQTADSVEFTMAELTNVMLAIQEGRYDVRVDSRVQGVFGQQVDQTIATLDTTIGDICRVMGDMRDGCFGARVEAICCGRLLELKMSINTSMIVLEEAIAAVVDVTNHQSQGDFNLQLDVNGKGQLEHLGHSINATSGKVHEMVQQIRQVSITVAQSSDSMQDNATQLWEHTNSHSAAIAMLLEKVDLIRASIQTNRDSVQQASSLVDRSREAADAGTGIANRAIGLMEDINEKSRKIASITQVLDTIARQTNLLALNAAVEAARAREHGSGFSVVANEVKELARQSAEASMHITALIQAVTQDIRLGAESVENTGQALQAIALSISDVEHATRAIAKESLQQENGMDNIVQIVSNALKLMESDLKLVDTSRDTSESLGELAYRVNELLAFFKSAPMDAQASDLQAGKGAEGIKQGGYGKAA